MNYGIPPIYVEQLKLATEFVERVSQLGVWLPQPSIAPHEIEFAFSTWQLPHDLRLTMSEEEQARAVVERFRNAARAIGGRWEKNDPKVSDWNDRQYIFTNAVDVGTAKLRLRMERDLICERKVVGTKEVVKPAVEAQPERVVIEEVYERECKPLFANAERELDAAMLALEAEEGVLEGELEDA